MWFLKVSGHSPQDDIPDGLDLNVVIVYSHNMRQVYCYDTALIDNSSCKDIKKYLNSLHIGYSFLVKKPIFYVKKHTLKTKTLNPFDTMKATILPYAMHNPNAIKMNAEIPV